MQMHRYSHRRWSPPRPIVFCGARTGLIHSVTASANNAIPANWSILIPQLVPDENDRHRILVENPLRLFDFNG